MNLLRGLSSYALGWTIRHQPAYTPLELVLDAHRLGLDSVQICDNLPVTALDGRSLETLRREAGERGVTLQLGLRGLTRDNVLNHLELCTRLNATLLRAVIDAPPYEPSLQEVGTLIRALLPEFRARGVTLGIENHDRFHAQALAETLHEVDDPLVRVCLDTANSLGTGEGLQEVVCHLGPLTVNLHVKEFTIRRLPHQYGFVVEGAPLGQGLVDWAQLLTSLPALSSLSLEQWAPELPTPKATVEQERQWLIESVPVLHTWAVPGTVTA